MAEYTNTHRLITPDTQLRFEGVNGQFFPETLTITERKALATVGQPSAAKEVAIAPAAFGPAVGVIGAAALAISCE